MSFTTKLLIIVPLLKFVFASPALAPFDDIPAGNLLPRVEQQGLTNPDNEPPSIDLISGSEQEKSRVLSGIGPQEAINRWWDWDESCADDKDRAIIASTFKNTMSLAGRASSHLQTLSQSLPNTPKASRATPENKRFILKNDQAFAQMFGGKDEMIGYAKDTFDLVTSRAQSFEGRNGQGAAGLRFICDREGNIKDDSGETYCSDDAQAITVVVQSTSIEEKYQFASSSGIVFCPPFFDDAQFPTLETREAQTEHTLDKVDCKERILLHEYMHLEWIRDMDPRSAGHEDATGYLKAAKVGAGRKEFLRVMPDCYAWLALYSYFNDESGGCGDVWPKGVKKPTTKA